MSSPRSSDVTGLLLAWRHGDAAALDRLLPAVYSELHRLAHLKMRREPPGQTLQTTALVHEAYVRLVDGTQVDWNNRAHFYSVCARLMRRILVDRARARRADKRGGDDRHVTFEEWRAGQPPVSDDVLAVDEALTRMAASDPRRAQVVELRYFGGMTVEEIAAALGVSPETVARRWRVAKLWLSRELRGARSTRTSAGRAQA